MARGKRNPPFHFPTDSTRKTNRMKHTLTMLLGCAVPMLLLFILPVLGVNTGVTMAIVIALMLGCHLLMGGCGGHGHKHDEPH